MIVGAQKSQRAETAQDTKNHQHMVWPRFDILKQKIALVEHRYMRELTPTLSDSRILSDSSELKSVLFHEKYLKKEFCWRRTGGT